MPSSELAPRLLIVEDSATQAAALALLLERAGYRTLLARSAAKALELLDREAVDLVLSDVVMPKMDGYELCKRIKGQPAWQKIPVVLVTSLTDPLAIVRGLASGADHYVTKPYDTEGLLGRLRFVLAHAADTNRVVPAPVEIELLGEKFTIRAMKEQILELLVSSYSDLMRTSEVVREAERRARFLAEATERLTATLDAAKVLADLARLAVPHIADFCAVNLVSPDSSLRRVAIAHALPDVGEFTAGDASAFVDAVSAGTDVRVTPLPDAAALNALTTNAEVVAALGERGAQELIVVPLISRGRVLGVIQLVVLAATRASRADDMPLIVDLMRRAALAVDNALLYEEARRATRARDDVLAIVSHDLRNPLNSIQMATSFLLDVLPTPAGKDVAVVPQLKIVQRATRRANALIQDLLDVSRIDAGTLAVSKTAIEGSALLNEAAQELESLVVGQKLAFTHEWKGPDMLIGADRGRVGQVFSNLVGNAIKFTKAGGSIRIEGAKRDGMVDFDVIDTGAGIPPEHLPHLFDRFWQATTTTRAGAGLGLFIVKGIVEAHGGTLAIESVVGEGTRFRFSLPAAST